MPPPSAIDATVGPDCRRPRRGRPPWPPRPANRAATARPIPEPAPVTTATRSAKRLPGVRADGGVGGIVLGSALAQGDPLDRDSYVALLSVVPARTARAGCASGSCRPGCGAPPSTSSSCSGMAWTRRPCPRRYSTMSSKAKDWPSCDGHHCAGPLAGLRVGQADDRHVGHGRVGVEEVLHLLGRDVLAVADDHVLQAAGDGHVAVLVHDAEVATSEVARRRSKASASSEGSR